MNILANNGSIIAVDAADYTKLAKHRWYIHKGYAVTNIRQRKVRMHRMVLRALPPLEVDHLNGNKLDNRKCNLRLTTRQINGRNVGKSPRNKSGVVGVYRNQAGYWVATIGIGGHDIYLGRFQTLRAAASVRKSAEMANGFIVRD